MTDPVLEKCLRELRATKARSPTMRRVAKLYDAVEPVGVAVIAAVQLFAALSLLS